jgi:spermidine synthase
LTARAIAVLAASALVGAAGMGLELVGLAAAGLALGHARAGAFGLASFVSAWALGAYVAGRMRGSLRLSLLGAGVLAFAASPIGMGALFWTAHGPRSGAAAGWIVAVAALLALALPQGALFTLLVRAYRSQFTASAPNGVHEGGAHESGGIAPLWAANLIGCVWGAFGLGFFGVSAYGRTRTALLSGFCALLGASIASLCVRPSAVQAPQGGAVARLTAGRAGLLIGVTTTWLIGLEWILLRLGALLFESTQWALSSLLACSLLGLCAGGCASGLLPPRLGSARLLVFACVLGTGWPHAFVRLLGPSGEAGMADALALAVPALAPFGALLPLLYRLREGESGARVGALILHETWGAWLGAPLTHAFLVPRLGLGGSTGALSLCAVPAALALAGEGARRSALALFLAACAAWLVYSGVREPALHTSALARQEFSLQAFEEDSHFSVAVVDDGLIGERTLLTDRFRAAGTGRSYLYMRALAHLPLLLHGRAKRVGVLALGTGTTLGAVALHQGVEAIDVLELSSAVVDQAAHFEAVNRGVLGPEHPDPRVRILLGDGRSTLAGQRAAYDVLTMEPLLPSSPFGVYLYTREFYARAQDALAPGGLLCQWIPPHALEPEAFHAVVSAAVDAFGWSGIFLFGQHALVVCGAARPQVSPAGFAGTADDTGSPRRGDLPAELRELGLADCSSLIAGLVCEGSDWPSTDRPLTDDDPWIALARPVRDPLDRLDNLPANLERMLAEWRDPLDAELGAWTACGGAEWSRLRQGARALLQARAAHARSEYELRAGATERAAVSERTRDERLARARELLPSQAAVEELAGEVEFVRSVRAVVLALQADAFGRGDLDGALRAVELRPERADAHLYLACALNRLGVVEAAQAALAAALGRCPRLFETPPGERALALGWIDPQSAILRQP